MKVLIIEDEYRAANQLQKMLHECGFQYELLGIIDTVEDSINWFHTNARPDLIFMDIQLADGLSFEIFQKIEVEVPIIFTTAFDQYAIQAFKVNSIDYLLKPIQKDDLQLALIKYNKTNNSSNVDHNVLKQLLSDLNVSNARSGILVKEGSSFRRIKTSDLLYIYSEASITFGITENKRYVIDESMDQLMATLDESLFYRINRGQIVSKISILKLQRYTNHRVKLILKSQRDHEFIVSRSKTSEFKDWMNK